MKKVKILWNNEQIRYLFFGVLTMSVNYGVFLILTGIFGTDTALWANVISFVSATTVAFLTNKTFVFRARSWKLQSLLREGLSFLGARLFSFTLEQGGLAMSIAFLPLEEIVLFGLNGVFLAKVAMSALAVVSNYLFSKFLIFRKKAVK